MPPLRCRSGATAFMTTPALITLEVGEDMCENASDV
jgi:hypothetical protein